MRVTKKHLAAMCIQVRPQDHDGDNIVHQFEPGKFIRLSITEKDIASAYGLEHLAKCLFTAGMQLTQRRIRRALGVAR